MKPTPGSQLALFARYSYHAFITDRDGKRRWNWRPIIAATPRSRTPYATSSTAWRAEPHAVGVRFAANGAWLAVQSKMAHNLARWTARIGLGQGTLITKTLRRRVFALRFLNRSMTDHPLGTPPHFASTPRSPALALGNPVQTAMGRRWNWRPIIAATPRSRTPYATSSTAWPGAAAKPFHSRPRIGLGHGQPATDPTSPQSRATPVARVSCCVSSRHPAHRNSRIGP